VNYQLIIKHLFSRRRSWGAPEQEIVYRDLQRYSYSALSKRAGQLADGLAHLGIKPGDTIGVMDGTAIVTWNATLDPMMGAVLAYH